MLINPNIPLVGFDDGGLTVRQQLREVQVQMSAQTWSKRHVMRCGQCEQRGAQRKFRTWSALRDHLIDYHKFGWYRSEISCQPVAQKSKTPGGLCSTAPRSPAHTYTKC